MTLIRLTGAQLRELMQAARMVPPDLRDIFLERVVVHRVAYNVARAITWGRWTDGGDGLGALAAILCTSRSQPGGFPCLA